MPTPADLLSQALLEFRARNYAAAEALCRQILKAQPSLVDVRVPALLGNLLAMKSEFAQAVEYFDRALAIDPGNKALAGNLASALKESGQTERALEVLQAAIGQHPDAAELHYNLGLVFLDSRRPEQAVASFHDALRLRPAFAEALTNLGRAYRNLGLLGHAAQALGESIRLRPEYVKARSNLGVVLHEAGRVEEAILCLRQGLEILPNQPDASSNLLLYLAYSPAMDRQGIYEEHLRWHERLVRPLITGAMSHANVRAAQKRIRLGYVSSDFKQHSVAFFIEPILANHDRERFEVICFSNSRSQDDYTARLKQFADSWYELHGLTDEEAARLIQNEKIDILIDLSLHTRGNRLLLFALKPAPVQISMLGYPQTTGLAAMDYRLGDPYLDPPDWRDVYNSEKLLRMLASYFCYRPPLDAPEISAVPVRNSGQITFGCFNTLAKLNLPTARLWAEVMNSAPNSRLNLKARGLGDDSVRTQVLDLLAGVGIDRARVNLLAGGPLNEYLTQLGDLDIALDPTPFCGGATTCHTLWMGVPVISLAGETPVGRLGLSILTNSGMGELVAQTPQEYVRIAADLAGDLDRLERMRRDMRSRMRASPLMDEIGYTRALEDHYQTAWQTWVKEAGLMKN